MLRPKDTVQKILLSSPARFVAEFDTEEVYFTLSWNSGRPPQTDNSPLLRTFFVLSFKTVEIEKLPGTVIPDYTFAGDYMSALVSVLFGKRFDSHGAIEMNGNFFVPNLDRAADLCDVSWPFHGSKLRADLPVPLDLREMKRIEKILNGEVTDIGLYGAFRTAALFYSRALRMIGRDPEVAYLHLITACERLAEEAPLADVELEAEVKTALLEIERQLPDGDRVAKLFRKRMRQLRRRFSALITSHLDEGFFTRTEAADPIRALQKKNFPRAAAAAYDLRSRYVHAGDSFGHWIAPRYGNGERQLGRPSVHDGEMSKILARAPTFVGLERITRYLMLKCAKQLGADLSFPEVSDGAEASQ